MKENPQASYQINAIPANSSLFNFSQLSALCRLLLNSELLVEVQNAFVMIYDRDVTKNYDIFVKSRQTKI